MRYRNMPPLSALALATCVFFVNSGCDGDGQPPTDSADETATVYMELGACSSVLECEDLDYEALGIMHLQSCLACSCAPSPDDPEVDTLQLSFLASCEPELECLTDLDCASLENACNTAECVATNCVVVPIADPTPEASGTCELRSCDPESGWGDVPEEEGVVCDDDDACTMWSSCDGAGECIAPAEAYECCNTPADCVDYGCPTSSFNACVDTDHEDGFYRCACAPTTLWEYECGNGTDDDSDGLADCADPDCATAIYCESEEPTGSCCEPHGGLGCMAPFEGAPTQGSVCDIDPWCCSVIWDSVCVSNYEAMNLGICAEKPPAVEICGDTFDNDGDGLWDCDDPDCVDDPACAPLVEDCSTSGDEDDNGLSDCADPACVEFPACVPETTEVSLSLNSPWYFQGCAGPTSGLYPSCSWELNAGQVVTWDPAKGETFLFTFTNGSSWPLQVNCATGAVSLTGGVTFGSVFSDPDDLVELGCVGVCKDGGQQVLCTGVPPLE